MSTFTPQLAPESPAPLSEPQRLLHTFTAPSKTFADVKRNPSWWAPWLLMAVISLLVAYAVQRRVGFEHLAKTEISQEQQAQEAKKQSTEDREQEMRMTTVMFTVLFYATPLILLIYGLLIALALWTTFNYGMSVDITFKTMLALVFYAITPQNVLGMLLMVGLLMRPGFVPASFNLDNPAPANLAAFMDYPPRSQALYELATAVDIFNIWALLLLALGLSIVTNVTRAKAFKVVATWYIGAMLGFTLLAITE